MADANPGVRRSEAERPGWHSHRFSRRRSVAQAVVRSGLVGVVAPPAGDAADLPEVVDDLAIEQFVAQVGLES